LPARAVPPHHTSHSSPTRLSSDLSGDPASMYYAVFVTPGNGIVVQYRNAQGGTTAQPVKITGTVPAYLMVARTGSTYTAYTSSDGNAWTPVVESSFTLNMSVLLVA